MHEKYAVMQVIKKECAEQANKEHAERKAAGKPQGGPIPYELNKQATKVTLNNDQLRGLSVAVQTYGGSGITFIADTITSHARCNYYNHLLKPNDSVALRVPPLYNQVMTFLHVLHISLSLYLHVHVYQLQYVYKDDQTVKVLDKHQHKNNCCIIVGTITRLLTVQLNGTPTQWLEMWLGEIQWNAVPLDYLRFKLDEKHRYYIPLGWCGWTVAKCLLLMIDPLAPKSNCTLFLYNHRIKWEITDRWPTSVQSASDDNNYYDNTAEYFLAADDTFYNAEEMELARVTQLENTCWPELSDEAEEDDDAACYNPNDSDYEE